MTRILVADDQHDLLEFLDDELTDAGFFVKTVDNGADAVVFAAEEPFDLFLLDMLMPGLTGIQAIKVLRKVAPGTPVIGLTGYLGRGFMAQAAALGVTCLSKPVEMDELLAEIHNALAVTSASPV
ncbi:MAG: response regulator [Chloroflexi bacterium]|nr:MAG: response regulator [Chloroflexota bacterium]